MKVCVGCQEYPGSKVTVEERGSRITAEFAASRQGFVSVKELEAHPFAPKERIDFFQEIDSLYINLDEPCFRIFFRDGSNIWIRIHPEVLDIVSYSGKPFPKYQGSVRVPFPEKVQEEVAETGK